MNSIRSFKNSSLKGEAVGETDYSEIDSAADLEKFLNARPADAPLAIVIDKVEPEVTEAEEEEIDSPAQGSLALGAKPVDAPRGPEKISLAHKSGSAVVVSLKDAKIREVVKRTVESASIPKVLHDIKAAIHAIKPLNIELNGAGHDTFLYAYLLDPTYTSYALKDIALRRLSLEA